MGALTSLLDRLYHLHWVTPEAARSAQPYLGFYGTFLAARGIRGLVNLRGANPKRGWWWYEGRVAAARGIARFDVKLSSRKIPTRALVAQLFDAFESAPKPLLFKCSGGQDRTGLAAALYLLHVKGPSALTLAEHQFAAWPYLHWPKRHQRWLRHFPRFAVEDAGGMALARWAREHYEPQRFAAWLTARGLADSYEQIQREKPVPAPALTP